MKIFTVRNFNMCTQLNTLKATININYLVFSASDVYPTLISKFGMPSLSQWVPKYHDSIASYHTHQ